VFVNFPRERLTFELMAVGFPIRRLELDLEDTGNPNTTNADLV
jgi:hypothetical protein